MIKIHFVSGWSEGKWHFKQFASAFDEGYALENRAELADVIIAHSSGCYSLPPTDNARLVMLIDPPYWPGKSLLIRILENTLFQMPRQIRIFGSNFWLKLRFWNLIYAIIEPWKHIKVWRSPRQTLFKSVDAEKAILIRDDYDPYCSPESNHLALSAGVKFISLNGLHESCWASPEKYFNVIKKHL